MSNTKTKIKEISQTDLIKPIIDSLKQDATEEQNKIRDELIRNYLNQVISKHPIMKNYNVLILHDETSMMKTDADYIYYSVTAFKEKKPILLILYSSGGSIDSAYLIGKLCREYALNNFVVVVPRQAKSAATLLCCAADQIHMGSMSELGPIDPQINKLPALGLKNSVEHLADLVKQNPAASDMFAKYLSLSLAPIHIGYYERVAESAAQYAERLLTTHATNLKSKPFQIAHELVYTYKDHAFVIDKTEATNIFGDKVIKTGTPEYDLGNSVYQAMKFISRITDYMKYVFYFIGSPESSPNFIKKT